MHRKSRYFNSLLLGACTMQKGYVLANKPLSYDALGCCMRDHVGSDRESNHLIAINKYIILSN